MQIKKPTKMVLTFTVAYVCNKWLFNISHHMFWAHKSKKHVAGKQQKHYHAYSAGFKTATFSWSVMEFAGFTTFLHSDHKRTYYRRTIFFWHWIFNILSFNFARWASGRLIILWTPDTKDKMPINNNLTLEV